MRIPRGRQALLAIAAAALGLPAAGCGYRLAGQGRFLPADIHTIAVAPFDNITSRSEIEDRITEQLVEELDRRGEIRTTTPDKPADARLTGTVTAYTTLPVTFTGAGKASRVQVTVQARVSLTDLRTGAVIWRQDHFVFRADYDVSKDQATYFDQEILAIDLIARDCARTIATSLLEGF